MKVQTLRRITLFVLNVTMAASLLAQGGRGRLYNPSTETTVQGRVLTVDSVAGRRGWSGIHLTLESKDVKYDVHVGPKTYVDGHGFKFAVGDQLQVVGSEVASGETKSLIARKIEKEGKTLVLRDKHGFPVWSRAGAPSN